MTLQDYLKRHQLTQAEFAAAIGKNPSIITRILKGETKPDMDTMEAIEHGSCGFVTAHDFYKKKPTNGARKR